MDAAIEHPDTDVVVQYIPWLEAPKKFQAALAGGEGPDITELGNTETQGWAAQEALAAVESVEGDVRLVTLVPEELGRPVRPLPRRDEVEVRVRAPECRQEFARRAEPDRHPAQESQRHVCFRRAGEQSLALGDDVGVDHHAVRASSASPCRR